MAKALRVETAQDVRNAFNNGVLKRERSYYDDDCTVYTGAQLYDIVFSGKYNDEDFDGAIFIEC